MDDLKKVTKAMFLKTELCLIIIKPRLKARAQFMICLKACNDKGITYTAKDTMYSVYIVGINNIDEKDCGKTAVGCIVSMEAIQT